MAASRALQASAPPGAQPGCDWPTLRTALIERAAAPYRAAGHFAYHFARGKLKGDPIFRALLEQGLLAGRERILDLGCGQGLLAAWMAAARLSHQAGRWPPGWPPPSPTAVRGIELKSRDVERARRALGGDCKISQGDIGTAAFGNADAVVIIDVLHYLPAASHREVLRRVRAALPADGRLLLRVGDTEAGVRFRITLALDRLLMLARGQGLTLLNCRSLREWRALLSECGFDSESVPMSRGTPFANVLLVARAR
jgi:SAM-dependent methyltransferase